MMNYQASFLGSFKYAFEGIVISVKNNRNFRIQIMVALCVILASLFFKVNPFEMGILGVMIILVLVCEMINTALEEIVDLVSSEHRVQAKIAKDVGAGLVLLASIGSLIVGFLIFTPYIIKFFS